MAVSIPDFWRLAVESRLLAAADCDRLNGEFAVVKGAASQSNAVTLGEWLVAGRALTRYQARTLLAGQAGPFFYGDYYVYDRIRSKEGRLAGLMRAMHMPTRHPVLLYFITGAAAKDPQWWQVAVQQVAWACSVGHPFVAQCYQLLELGRYKVVAIEDLLGDPAAGGERPAGAADSTLAARLAPGERLAPADACRVAYQIGLGLARLQQLGQVHGSIWPENIWLAADGSAKLLQVPLAPEPATGPGPLDWTAADPNGRLSLAADYAAPELAQLGRPPDMCSDVYALGATLYQMLSGWPPFPGGDAASKLSRHASEFPVSLEQFGAPQPVDQLVGYLLAKDPAGRYQSAAQVAEALAYFVDPAVVSYVPPFAATASTYDLWLETQPRVPGMAPGAIPTASSLAIYTAAQYEAARNGAAQNAAAESGLAYPMHPAAQDYMPAPAGQQGSEQASSFFESIQPTAPGYDAAGFVGAEASAPPPEFADWGAAAAAAPQEFTAQAEYAAGPYAATQPAGGGAAVAEAMVAAAAAPAALNLDAVLNSAPLPVKSKSRKAAGSAAPKAKLSPLALAGLGGGLAVVAVVVGLVLFRALSGGTDDNGQVALDTTNSATMRSIPNGPTNPGALPGKVSGNTGDPGQSPKAPPARSPASGGNQTPVETVPDDGISLWASPTAGPPLPTDYIASGAQLILAVRPANILRHPDGDQLLPALGPWGDIAAHAVKDATGLDLNQVDQVLLVIHDGGDGKPVATAIFRTTEAMAPQERLPAWGNPTATTDGDATYYQGAKDSFFLPAKEGGKLLVVGPTAQIKEIIHPTDGPPAMPRSLELLLPHTDANRDVSLVFVPAYLFGDGQSVLSGPLLALKKPLEDYFTTDVGAAQLSLHFDANFFAELRTVGLPGKEASTLSDDLLRRLKAVPANVENDLDALNLHPYGRKLLRRLPEWMRLLSDYTRGGVDADEPVLRCYLPMIAAPNLLMGTELALAEQPIQGSGALAGGPKKPQTIAELLKKKTTLTFPRDTLEKSLQLLFEDVGIKYEILGPDLQLEGITKNQSFGLDEHDKPVEEILQKIMRLANSDGKLVYVIKPEKPGGPEMLFLTTRAAATKRGDKLPPGLEAGPAKPTPKKKS